MSPDPVTDASTSSRAVKPHMSPDPVTETRTTPMVLPPRSMSPDPEMLPVNDLISRSGVDAALKLPEPEIRTRLINSSEPVTSADPSIDTEVMVPAALCSLTPSSSSAGAAPSAGTIRRPLT